MTNIPQDEGWITSINARRSHYFKGQRSLCKRWTHEDGFKTGYYPECKECRRKLDVLMPDTEIEEISRS